MKMSVLGGVKREKDIKGTAGRRFKGYVGKGTLENKDWRLKKAKARV